MTQPPDELERRPDDSGPGDAVAPEDQPTIAWTPPVPPAELAPDEAPLADVPANDRPLTDVPADDVRSGEVPVTEWTPTQPAPLDVPAPTSPPSPIISASPTIPTDTAAPGAAPTAPLVGWETPAPAGAAPGREGYVIAGMGARLVAYFIDSLLVSIIPTILTLLVVDYSGLIQQAIEASRAGAAAGRTAVTFPVTPELILVTVISLAIQYLFFVGFWTSGGRATPGMRGLRMQVVDAATGATLSLAAATKRFIALGSALALLILVPALQSAAGVAQFALSLFLFFTAITNDRRQGLHDKWAELAGHPLHDQRGRRGGDRLPAAHRDRGRFRDHPARDGARRHGPVSRGTDPRGGADHLSEDDPRLDAAQREGLTDIDPAAFRAAAHAVVDVMADYLDAIEDRPVFPPIEPGSLRPLFPAAPPEAPVPLAAILDDYRRLIEPNATHWQHPGFFAYFPTTASGPGILGEMLTAALGQNAMLWRTSPIGTELEEVVVDWLRQALGLPRGFDGLLTDTASTSSLIAIAAARQAAGLDVAAAGLAGRLDVPALRVYASTEAHSSIEKACMTLGLGRGSLVRVPVDDRFAMRPEALATSIASDRAAGHRPIAVVATLGTTSSTAVDPVADIADIAGREGLWLHVDSAYAGVVAMIPERRGPFAGWERADSIVVNPHKWLFTPLDASLLLTPRMSDLRAAFSLVPEYLRTLDRDAPVRDYNEYQPQLGRRFRALKLWIQLRWFGLEGLRRRIERHLELAQGFAGWVDADPDWERLAPVPFSTVCFRWNPRRGETDEELDVRNAAIMDAVNRDGAVFLSHTRLAGRFTIRLAIGNIRTEERHVERAWALLREAAAGWTP